MADEASFSVPQGYFALSGLGRIRVTGADRLRYLNGQTSNDLRKLQPGSALGALVLTAKGKICAPVQIWEDDDAHIIETVSALSETLLARLERYAIADDVSFELMESPRGWHVIGTTSDGLRISRLGESGVDVSTPPAGLQEFSADEVERLRILRGIPAWGAEIDEDTLPQEARLDATAVDFHKGCYVGQEVVSRLRSVGRVNEILTLFHGDISLPSGRRPWKLADSQGANTARLTSIAPASPPFCALGYVSTRSEEKVFSVLDETGACLGRVEKTEFPLTLE
ncbi:hypothetical protein TSACC_3593 [Terrimicrobium sacchariphilum]|uniref:Uncharacterized protein n=1 Tax=Terrimicrobium sacchariphilum TaxID=690879 RepID=A0A146GFW0_TERSA|nr:folate-binding protein YgfZ [Terrimicrobium sacchariphilum]GAT35524.1 hypothetical protein TSACC_3593 [Terrimicrobium sacchariphilum]